MLILASILLIVLSIKATAKPTSCDAKCTATGMFVLLIIYSPSITLMISSYIIIFAMFQVNHAKLCPHPMLHGP